MQGQVTSDSLHTGATGRQRINSGEIQLGREVHAGQVLRFEQDFLQAGITQINATANAGQRDAQSCLTGR